MAYAKGEKPRDLDAAKGGLVLERSRNFAKDQDDDLHPLGTGLLGPLNEQNYGKGNQKSLAKREGDSKCMTPIKPRT